MILFSLYFLILIFLQVLHRLRDYLFPLKGKRFGRKMGKETEIKKSFYRSLPKPKWVRHEVMKLKAIMPDAGCRTIANTFNRMFLCEDMSVGKSFVYGVFQKYDYQIQVLRRKIKNARPRLVPRNLIWGMDLTGKMDECGNLNNILGIVEHKSRASLCLTALKDKASITILRYLLNAVERFGKPKILRTDNEAVFTSWLFKIVLMMLGIRHKPIQKGCPWQNGRIERFFGTLKEKMNQIEVYPHTKDKDFGVGVYSREGLNHALYEFRFWYNHVRTHQNLDGRTPAEVWAGKDIFNQESKQKPKRKFWFEAWEGLLTGIYLE